MNCTAACWMVLLAVCVCVCVCVGCEAREDGVMCGGCDVGEDV